VCAMQRALAAMQSGQHLDESGKDLLSFDQLYATAGFQNSFAWEEALHDADDELHES
jgi:hypothetical protein